MIDGRSCLPFDAIPGGASRRRKFRSIYPAAMLGSGSACRLLLAPMGSPTELGPRRKDADRGDVDSDLSEFSLAGTTAGSQPNSGLAMPSASRAGGRASGRLMSLLLFNFCGDDLLNLS